MTGRPGLRLGLDRSARVATVDIEHGVELVAIRSASGPSTAVRMSWSWASWSSAPTALAGWLPQRGQNACDTAQVRVSAVHAYLAALAFSAPALAQPADPADPAEDVSESAPPPEPASTIGTLVGLVEAPDLEAPLAGAMVTVVGTELSATTDDEGRYQLEAPPGAYRVRAEVAGFKPVEKAISVAAGATETLDFQLVTAPVISTETIVVIGSRTPRTNAESPVAVDVITAADLARTGRTQTGRILHRLAASYMSTPQTVADGTDHVDPGSLRGLGPDQVLILVNGKRRHRSALLHVNGTFGRGTVGTDLNAIAVGSIKRIEILRDGAAAQYGSDAIAGVINIVTKDTTDILGITAQSGITAARDGLQLRSSANYGFKIGGEGFVNITGEYLEKQATNRAGVYNGPVYSDDPALDQMRLLAEGRTRDDFGMRIGEAASNGGMGAYNLELPVADSATFYSFGDLAHRRGRAAGFYRFPRQVAQNVPEFYPHGFLPEIHPTISDRAITVGIRRKGTWAVDASVTHGRNSFKFNAENSVNASLGTASPTTFDAGTLHFEQTVADLDLVRTVDTDHVKSLAFVLGTELRVERFRIDAGDVASYSLGTEQLPDGTPKLPGAQVFPGFQPSNEVDRTRDNVGVYSGVESELTKNIAVDIGGRFESYSDFGRSVIGKAAGRARIAGPLSVRAAVNTGFRAPSLHQLWFSNVSTLFLPDADGMLQPAQVLTSNNQSPVTRAFAIPRLREERSTNLSGGLTLRPRDNFSVTVDGYFIRIRDRVVLTSQFTNTNPIVAGILAPFPGVSQAQFFANAADTDTTGLDVVLDYSVDAGQGTLTATGSANLSRTRVTNINIPRSLEQRFAADRAQLETFYFGRQARNRLEDAIPRHKATAALRYAIEGLSALVRANYYGPVYFRPDNPENDERFGAKVLFDVDLGYQVTQTMTLSVGADNLFDTYPDQQKKDANRSFNRFLYSRNVSQFGQNGGFYYAKLDLTFF
jgi:iron complex outermembrane recepter protein